jgi:hypothetical protein
VPAKLAIVGLAFLFFIYSSFGSPQQTVSILPHLPFINPRLINSVSFSFAQISLSTKMRFFWQKQTFTFWPLPE